MINGIVTSLEPKDWNGNTLWSFKVDGGRIYYRTGRVDPATVGITVGKRYSFSVDGKNNVDIATVQEQAGGSTVTQNAPVARTTAPDDRQQRIEAQSARRDAISTVSFLLESGIIDFPKGVKVADKPAFVAGLVKQFSDHFNPYEAFDMLQSEEEKVDSLYE